MCVALKAWPSLASMVSVWLWIFTWITAEHFWGPICLGEYGKKYLGPRKYTPSQTPLDIYVCGLCLCLSFHFSKISFRSGVCDFWGFPLKWATTKWIKSLSFSSDSSVTHQGNFRYLNLPWVKGRIFCGWGQSSFVSRAGEV